MNINFACQKGGYIFAKDENPCVTVDLHNTFPVNKTVDMSVTLLSMSTGYSECRTLHKTVKDNHIDNFIFEFSATDVGVYIASVEVAYEGGSDFASVSLDIVESKPEPSINNYNKRIIVGDGREAGFANSKCAATPGAERNAKYYSEISKTTVKASAKMEKADFAKYTNYYAYEVSGEEEYISYPVADGLRRILASGGSFAIRDNANNLCLEGGKVTGIEENGNSLTVYYEAKGDTAAPVNLSNTYTFFDKYISVACKIVCNDLGFVPCAFNSRLERNFVNGYDSVRKNFNCDWRYPTNKDYPYKYLDCWSTVNTVDDTRVYTYNRGDIELKIWDYYVRYPETDIFTNFENKSSIDYTLTYDLVLTDDNGNTDYDALFISKGSDFAVGVAPSNANDDNTSLFIGKEQSFCINLKNLSDSDTAVTVKYDLRDYYGNVLNVGVFDSQKLLKGDSLAREFSVDPQKYGYGMFFFNLTAKSDKYIHREYYPFAILEEHEYKYNATSLFGINQILGNEDVPLYDSLSICNKIGVAATRGAFMDGKNIDLAIDCLKKVKEKGIRVMAHPYMEHSFFLNEFLPYYDEFILGNEMNLPSIFRIKSVEECYEDYYNTFYKIAKEEYFDKYGKKIITAGISAGQPEWYEELYKRGIWDEIHKIDLHTYGIPYAPDCKAVLGNIWSMEGGLIRTVEALEKYGKKPYQVNETGYFTGRPDDCVSLRTQADYNTRCFVLSVGYGAEHACTYCFYDYSNGGVGTLMSDMEYHYGNFYYPDYFGRILPKPAAIAFANMTRVLESSTSAKEAKCSGGVNRVFEFDTKEHGKVYAAWSNCSPLANDITEYRNLMENPGKREIGMPWQNQWKSSDRKYFRAAKDEVIVVDLMGKKTVIPKLVDGTVGIDLTGAPVFIIGVE